MSESVTVVHLIDGTVTEKVHTGDRVTSQHQADGLAVIKVYRDGRLVQGITYRNAEICDRVLTYEQEGRTDG